MTDMVTESQDVLTEVDDHVYIITLNRTHKQNAFDETLLASLHQAIYEANHNDTIRVIMLRANGRHFSAGADLNWMKRMASFSEAENIEDAKKLADLLASLHHSVKPTIAVVQGAAFGGGAGLAAACDITIAANTASFCFSEVRLGLIPAVISPYVIQAIGPKTANWLFMSAERFNGVRALELGLVQHCIAEEELLCFGHQYARQLATHAPSAVKACKKLVYDVHQKPINDALQAFTAKTIAEIRASQEAQSGMQAFLNKTVPVWDK